MADPTTLAHRGAAGGMQAGDRAAEERVVPLVCEWTEAGGPWATGCGRMFEVVDGTPTSNGFRFCVFCGGALVEVRHG